VGRALQRCCFTVPTPLRTAARPSARAPLPGAPDAPPTATSRHARAELALATTFQRYLSQEVAWLGANKPVRPAGEQPAEQAPEQQEAPPPPPQQQEQQQPPQGLPTEPLSFTGYFATPHKRLKYVSLGQAFLATFALPASMALADDATMAASAAAASGVVTAVGWLTTGERGAAWAPPGRSCTAVDGGGSRTCSAPPPPPCCSMGRAGGEGRARLALTSCTGCAAVAFHWFTGPYIHKLEYEPSTQVRRQPAGPPELAERCLALIITPLLLLLLLFPDSVPPPRGAAQTVQAHTLNIFAREQLHTFTLPEVEYADSWRPLSSFQVRRTLLLGLLLALEGLPLGLAGLVLGRCCPPPPPCLATTPSPGPHSHAAAGPRPRLLRRARALPAQGAAGGAVARQPHGRGAGAGCAAAGAAGAPVAQPA
jgi:hypothetical protein